MLFRRAKPRTAVIRPLRAEKAEACARIHAADFAHPWSAQEIAAIIARPTTLSAAALDPASGALRGFVLARLAAEEAEILTVAVEAAARSRGVGRALLAEMLRQAGNAGARAVFLEVNERNAPALALYRRLGFTRVGERVGYYHLRDGSRATAAIMRKSIA